MAHINQCNVSNNLISSASHKYFFFKFSLFNEEIVSGKMAQSIFWACAPTAYLIVNGAFMTLFIAICHQHKAFFQQFQYKAQKLDKENVIKSLHDLIEFDLRIKE